MANTRSDSHFSATYEEARRRFQESALVAGATVTSHRIDAVSESQDQLAIDVAIFGTEDAPAIVTSSGVHGVEGFLGSAVQHALLQRERLANSPPGVRHVLIHGVNPFGFSRLRRFNEDNVDLNRNFLASADDYQGAPEGYAGLNRFLNPESPPTRFEPFKLRAVWNIWRKGLQTLKQAVAGGQYEYPRGLFYGGSGPCKSTRIVCENCDSWIGRSQNVVHIDFHSGLGSFGSYKLLLTEGADSSNYAWCCDTFGSEFVEPLAAQQGTAYKVSGLFGQWMQNHFNFREYRFVGAEFGTYGPIRVLGALRAENRAHHYGSEQSAIYKRSKKELLECFCPRDASWRSQIVQSGLRIIDQAAETLQ